MPWMKDPVQPPRRFLFLRGDHEEIIWFLQVLILDGLTISRCVPPLTRFLGPTFSRSICRQYGYYRSPLTGTTRVTKKSIEKKFKFPPGIIFTRSFKIHFNLENLTIGWAYIARRHLSGQAFYTRTIHHKNNMIRVRDLREQPSTVNRWSPLRVNHVGEETSI